MNSINKYFLLLGIFVAGVIGCKKWDDHTAIGNQDLTMDLSQAIDANADLSKFREYVTKAGLDSILHASQTFTIWAPDNDALQSLDPAIVNDEGKLRRFILNHIASQSFFTRDAQPMVRVPMLNGKYNNFSAGKFEDANITNADKFVKNGVLHVIDKSISVLPSVWEFITSTKDQYQQNAYIAGLDYEALDSSLATVDSISSTTGLPVFHPGTGIVIKNRFDENVYNTRAEDKEYTYFVIEDAGFTKESDSLSGYFVADDPAITDSLSKWHVVKDLMVEGIYPASALTGLVSKSGVPLPLEPGMIVETRQLSNGVVHIFSTLDVPTANKFPKITIEGEFPTGFFSDKTGNTNYRVRRNPMTNQNFSDIMISGHGVSNYYAYYIVDEVPSIKYKVYALGVNDFQSGSFTQKIIPKFIIGQDTTEITTISHAVPLSTAADAYEEKLLGEFTVSKYGKLDIQLTSSGTSPLVLDYMRLEPVP